MRPDDPAYAGEKPDKGERLLHGLGVSPGIAIGPAFISDDGEVAVPDYRVAADQVEAERARFAAALAAALKQLRKLKGKSTTLPGSAAEEMGYLLDAHIAMLTNSRLVRGVERRISEDRVNAERAVQMEIAQISESFAEMGDAYLAARVEDIRVVGARLGAAGGAGCRRPSRPYRSRRHGGGGWQRRNGSDQSRWQDGRALRGGARSARARAAPALPAEAPAGGDARRRRDRAAGQS